jgi:hypothetical protein
VFIANSVDNSKKDGAPHSVWEAREKSEKCTLIIIDAVRIDYPT